MSLTYLKGMCHSSDIIERSLKSELKEDFSFDIIPTILAFNLSSFKSAFSEKSTL